MRVPLVIGRLLGLIAVVGLGACNASAQALATAPESATTAPSPVLTVDQDRLYKGSRFGQGLLLRIDDQFKALETENRKIESDLENEERSLTDRRSKLAPEEFHSLADAFDKKVKGIRAARDAKARDIAAQRDTAQKEFLKTAIPVLAAILTEKGAVALLDRSAIILSLDRIDITDVAIARIDATFAKAAPGSAQVPPAVAPAPSPP